MQTGKLAVTRAVQAHRETQRKEVAEQPPTTPGLSLSRLESPPLPSPGAPVAPRSRRPAWSPE